MARRISSSSALRRSREVSSSARSSGSSPLGQQLPGALGVIGRATVFGGEPGGRLELAVGAAGRREALAVADHPGVGELGLELPEATFDLMDEVVDHRRPSLGAEPGPDSRTPAAAHPTG